MHPQPKAWIVTALACLVACCGDTGGPGAAPDAVSGAGGSDAAGRSLPDVMTDTSVAGADAAEEVAGPGAADVASGETVANADADGGLGEPAEPPPLSDPVVLDLPGDDIAIQPGVALGPAGEIALTWTGPDDDGSLGIHFQLLDTAGEPLGEAASLHTGVAGGQNEPSICALAGGGYVVAWSSDVAASPGPDGASLQVVFRRVGADGVALDAAERRVLTEIPGNHWLARVACEGGGGFVVAGVRPDPDGTFGAFAWRFDAAGEPAGDAMTLHTAASGDQVYPFVGAGAGTFVAAWEDSAHAGDGATRIVARRWSDGALGAQVVAHGAAGTPATLTAVAVDAWSGAALVAGVLAQSELQLAWLAAGGAAPAPIALGPDAGTPTYHPALASLGGDRYLAAWQAGVGAGAGVRVGRVGPVFLEDGPLVLEEAGVPGYRPAVAARGGRAVVAWTVKSEQTQFALRLAVLD